MNLTPTRLEVMDFLAQQMDTIIDTYLTTIDNNWQPSDLLPVSNNENFLQEIKETKDGNKRGLHAVISYEKI